MDWGLQNSGLELTWSAVATLDLAVTCPSFFWLGSKVFRLASQLEPQNTAYISSIPV